MANVKPYTVEGVTMYAIRHKNGSLMKTIGKPTKQTRAHQYNASHSRAARMMRADRSLTRINKRNRSSLY